MSTAQFSAVITCVIGVIALLGWLWFTSENAHSNNLLFKSILLFVLPGAALAAIPLKFLQFPLAMWVGVFIEECLKATAAATEKDPTDRFWLLALFGIWELTLAKPLWALNHFALLEDWSNLQLAGLSAAGFVTVLMHSVTAEIYAFRFARRLPLALIISWALHTAFNESIGLVGVSLMGCLLLLLPLVLLFIALWPKRPQPVQSSSSS